MCICKNVTFPSKISVYIRLIGFKVLKAVFRLPFTCTNRPGQIPGENSNLQTDSGNSPIPLKSQNRVPGWGGRVGVAVPYTSRAPALPTLCLWSETVQQQKVQIWYATYNSIVLIKWEPGLSSGNLTIKMVQNTFSTFKSLMKTSINSLSLSVHSIHNTKILLIHQITSFKETMLSNYF